MDGSPLGRISSPRDRPIGIYTSPLLPGAFHRVLLSLPSETPGSADQVTVKICTLCESAHLQPTPSLASVDLPTVISPINISAPWDSIQGSISPLPTPQPPITVTSIHEVSPTRDAVGPSSVRHDSLPITLPSPLLPSITSQRGPPHSLSPRRLRPVDSFMASTTSLNTRESTSHGSITSSSQSSKNLHSYDMSTMKRSIEKWDPIVDLPVMSLPPDVPDVVASPMSLTARSSDTFPLLSHSSRSLSSSVRSIPTPSLHVRGSGGSGGGHGSNSSGSGGGSGFGVTGTSGTTIGSSFRDSHASSTSLVPSLRVNLGPTTASSSVLTSSSNAPLSSSTSSSSLGGNVSAFAHSLFSYLPSPAVMTSLSSQTTHTAESPNLPALWQRVCIRTLPVFSSGTSGFSVEALGDSVETYVRLVHERDAKHARAILHDQFEKLVSTGLHGMAVQLQQNDGLHLLSEFLRTWKHYYGTVIPFLHASFLPLESKLWSLDLLYATSLHRSDASNMPYMSNASDRSVDTSVPKAPSTQILRRRESDALDPPSPALQASPSVLIRSSVSGSSVHSHSFQTHRSYPRPSPVPVLSSDVPERMNIRRILLIMFRDHIVLPICDWLYMASSQVEYTNNLDHPASSPIMGLRPQLMHLVNIMNSLGTDDASQDRIERLRRGVLTQGAFSPRVSFLDPAQRPSLSAQLSPISPVPSHSMCNSTPTSPSLNTQT